MGCESVLAVFTDFAGGEKKTYNDPRFSDETIPYYSKAMILPQWNSFFSAVLWGDDRWFPGRNLGERTIRDKCILHFVYGGTATVNGVPVRRGDCFLTFPGIPHKICGGVDAPLRFFWVALYGSEVMKTIKRTEAFSRAHEISISNCGGNTEEILRIFRASMVPPVPEEGIPVYLNGCILQILGMMTSSLPLSKNPQVSGRVAEAIRIIDREASPDFSVEELSSRLHISRNHLYRLFISELGMSPKDYIVRRRVNAAAMLLESHDDLSLQQIAAIAGYSSYSQLTRAFRGVFGCTPREFRRKQTK